MKKNRKRISLINSIIILNSIEEDFIETGHRLHMKKELEKTGQYYQLNRRYNHKIKMTVFNIVEEINEKDEFQFIDLNSQNSEQKNRIDNIDHESNIIKAIISGNGDSVGY